MKAKRINYKGIPAAERANVKRLMQLRRSFDEPGTPQDLWGNIQTARAQKVQEQQAAALKAKRDEAKRNADNRAYYRKLAREDFSEGLGLLATVRDLLATIAKGDTTVGGIDWCAEDMAQMAHATFMRGASMMEQAGCDFGLIEASDCGTLLETERKCRMPKFEKKDSKQPEQAEQPK